MSISKNTKNSTTKITVTAMLSAIAIILQYLEISIPFVPSFLKLDFSTVPELLGSFAIGPMYGVLICLIKNLVHLPVSNSLYIGEFSNFVLGAIFAFAAGIIYKYNTTKKGAIIGTIIGAISMSLVSIITNYFIVYPIYAQLWTGGNIQAIVDMYKAVVPCCDTLIKALVIFNLPYNCIKGMLLAFITFLIYKPLSGVIYRLNTVINKKVDKNK